MGTYDVAQVCLNGHLANDRTQRGRQFFGPIDCRHQISVQAKLLQRLRRGRADRR